jgi:amino acid transporter
MEHTTPTTELKRSLGVVDGVVLAASSTAATTSIGIGLGVLASITGRQTPLVLLLGFLPMLGIASAYARLNKAEPNCGAGYVWAGRSMGPWLGMIAGWVPLAGVVVFLAYTTSVTGSVLVQCAHKAGLHSLLGWRLDANSTLQCTLIGLIVLAAATATAVTGVHKATRFQTYLLVFEYAVLLLFCCWGLIAGDQPFSLSWFDPFAFDSPASLAQGLVLAVFFYWGWDAAFSVTEETEQAGDAARGSCTGPVRAGCRRRRRPPGPCRRSTRDPLRAGDRYGWSGRRLPARRGGPAPVRTGAPAGAPRRRARLLTR